MEYICGQHNMPFVNICCKSSESQRGLIKCIDRMVVACANISFILQQLQDKDTSADRTRNSHNVMKTTV